MPVPPVYLTRKLLPLLVNIEPFAKLLNLPKIGLADVLLITVNTVPAVSGLVTESAFFANADASGSSFANRAKWDV